MPADGRPFVRREGVTALGENVDTASAVSTTVPTARLAKVVKESHDSDTVGREPARVGEHMVVYLNGVLCESAELFVMAVAAAAEEGRVVEVVDDGVRTGPSEGADGVEDPLLGVGNVLHILYLLRLKRANLSSDRSDCASPDADSGFQRKIWKNSIILLFYVQYKIKIYLSGGGLRKNLENSDFLLTFAP